MTPRPVPKQILGLLGWLCACVAAAAAGGIASAQAGPLYQAFVRPPWAPPGWLFGPVWTVLYLLMALSAWLVWREGGFRKAGPALRVFLCQLAVNALWTWLFFAWRQGALALAEILLLWSLILVTIRMFWRHNRAAALLLLPYWAWVSFASVLTWAIWRGNRLLLG